MDLLNVRVSQDIRGIKFFFVSTVELIINLEETVSRSFQKENSITK